MSLILWSGGCDSTLLLFYQASQALAAGMPMPRALSINYDQQLSIGVQQRKVRTAFLKELGRRGMKVEATEINVTKTGNLWAERHDGGGLIQPLFWLSFAQTFLQPDEDLCLAYIRGDDIWHYREHLFAAFNAGQAILRKTGSLLLPFEWSSKDDIVKELKETGLEKFTWYCECAQPGLMTPCGWCTCCKTMAAGRYLAKRKWGYDKPPTTERKNDEDEADAGSGHKAGRKKAVASDGRTRPAAQNARGKAARSRRVRARRPGKRAR